MDGIEIIRSIGFLILLGPICILVVKIFPWLIRAVALGWWWPPRANEGRIDQGRYSQRLNSPQFEVLKARFGFVPDELRKLYSDAALLNKTNLLFHRESISREYRIEFFQPVDALSIDCMNGLKGFPIANDGCGNFYYLKMDADNPCDTAVYYLDCKCFKADDKIANSINEFLNALTPEAWLNEEKSFDIDALLKDPGEAEFERLGIDARMLKEMYVSRTSRLYIARLAVATMTHRGYRDASLHGVVLHRFLCRFLGMPESEASQLCDAALQRKKVDS